MLVQWLYLGQVIFDEPTPAECITAIIEFVRLADMCKVKGMETLMADRTKAIILANAAPEKESIEGPDPDSNTYHLVDQHITSAALLPNGHPIRKVLATAAVDGYIRRNSYRFLNQMCQSPDFAFDLLLEVKETLKTVESGPLLTFTDPFSGKILPFVN
ncbi:hypothetical protein BJ875DRAFT_434446 [Amylocarpus encephaloides]|uniref:Uncharacterized protein n=1 Tax=Amylocarpus encephaloides TaxID=45428 RepID=A0A9P8C099_9HELO|nr:hypothetical protein BJ875DRAFT_434446 [Amylocarpus encephaloides]